MRKFDQSPCALKDGRNNPVGGIWIILSNVGADLVNITEGFRMKPVSTHAWGLSPLLRFLHQAPVGFLAVNSFQIAALHLVITTVEHSPDLKKLIEISDHGIFDEVVSPPPALRC